MYQTYKSQKPWETEIDESEIDADRTNPEQQALPGRVSAALNSITIVSDETPSNLELIAYVHLTPPAQVMCYIISS